MTTPDEHADEAPDERRDDEPADDGVVVDEPLDPFSHPGALLRG